VNDHASSSSDLAYFQNLRPEMLPFLPAAAERILELGCGEGKFGAACKARFGCEAWGIEVDPRAAAIAATRFDRLLQGDALGQARQLPDRSFDLIVCNDVLEHLVDPEQVLVELRRTLTPRGCIVASIPNIRYHSALWTILIDKDFPRDDQGIFDRTHLRFFTRKVIVRMFTDAGYSIERISGINRSRNRWFRLLNFLLLGSISDCRYLQFACVARPAAAVQ
jgi:2-polyprenyl-3-methyl-5-hydroxy-6-metoxy-1,4-benzoquinol methylase